MNRSAMPRKNTKLNSQSKLIGSMGQRSSSIALTLVGTMVPAAKAEAATGRRVTCATGGAAAVELEEEDAGDDAAADEGAAATAAALGVGARLVVLDRIDEEGDAENGDHGSGAGVGGVVSHPPLSNLLSPNRAV
eukprot:SAG11_NODE_16937_length_533_cov_0.933180_1_plen_135_part_00